MQRYLLGIAVAFAVLAFAYGQTDCETQRDANRGGPMTWDIQCDEDGYYKEMQCTTEPDDDKKWCACHNKTHQITPPSPKTRNCRCPLARNEAQNSNPPSDCPPQCKDNNKKYEFEEKQCCRRNDEDDCYCVDEHTGEREDDQSCLHHSH